MDGVILTPLEKIHHPKGEILKAIKKSDSSFSEFGEVYFSLINQREIKGWKKHRKMISNLIVINGEIEIVFHNENTKEFLNIKISQNNYQRITVKPGLWMAFRGIKENNILFNLSNIEHDPNEATNTDLHKIAYKWSELI